MTTTTGTLAVTIMLDPQVCRLAERAGTALLDAGMDEAAAALYDRLLSRSCCLLEARTTSRGALRMQLRPYAELVLLEAEAIARTDGESIAARTVRVKGALAMAGC